ncbi:uncharacterized protein Dere_GG26901 [Drosophila erecta]|uniref:Uncharacterized protein n=1 Tax=Drosophila erecta TaxID=7220 RepID=A0A0Q5U658_DROER|nr:uncharacterized protein Dere_GG26901 [Drosophila erecta]
MEHRFSSAFSLLPARQRGVYAIDTKHSSSACLGRPLRPCQQVQSAANVYFYTAIHTSGYPALSGKPLTCEMGVGYYTEEHTIKSSSSAR